MKLRTRVQSKREESIKESIKVYKTKYELLYFSSEAEGKKHRVGVQLNSYPMFHLGETVCHMLGSHSSKLAFLLIKRINLLIFQYVG